MSQLLQHAITARAQAHPACMLPVRWLACEALPRNANGKVDRPRLRSAFLEGESRQSSAPVAARPAPESERHARRQRRHRTPARAAPLSIQH